MVRVLTVFWLIITSWSWGREEAETESEDTLQLMHETRQQARRAAKESSARAQGGISIVDTIRNNLQNSKQEGAGAVQTQEEVNKKAGMCED